MAQYTSFNFAFLCDTILFIVVPFVGENNFCGCLFGPVANPEMEHLHVEIAINLFYFHIKGSV
jgi:hypothetical protein